MTEVGPSMLVGEFSGCCKKTFVFLIQAYCGVMVCLRDEDLSRVRKAHHPLCRVDAIADHILLPVQVFKNGDGPHVQAYPDLQCCISGSMQSIAKALGKSETGFRIRNEAQCSSVTRIQDNQILPLDAFKRLANGSIQFRLQTDLFSIGCLRITDNIQKNDGCYVSLFCRYGHIY